LKLLDITSIQKKIVVSTVEEQVLPAPPLLLGFGEESDDGEDFTPVISKRTKKKMRSAVKFSKRSNHSEGVKSDGGAQFKSSAASVKVHNNHPLCDIVSGSRVRKKKSKYL
jgi:hypothetical protein